MIWRVCTNPGHPTILVAMDDPIPEGYTAEAMTVNQNYLTEMVPNPKLLREHEVLNIKVTTASGKTFDGDERSQDRMSRAINAMDDGDVTIWVLADNTPTQVTKAELREALRLSGEAQTAIWVRPYQ